MILGIGLDMIEIERIGRAIQNRRFRERVYSAAERDWLDSVNWRAESAAGRFAAKEAAAKALNVGFGKVHWTDIEIVPEDTGRPRITLYGEARRVAKALGVKNMWVTLTHDRGRAAACVIAEGDGV
jgi:holo-[acyl-carrier protein] synthase